MKNYFLAIVFFISVGFCTGQSAKTPLDLRTAVLEQYGSLAPADLNAAKWVANSGKISHTSKDGKVLYVRNSRGDTLNSIALDVLNAQLGEDNKLRRLNIRSWIDENSFVFEHGHAFYVYHIEKDKLAKRTNCPAEGTNLEYHTSSGHLAYTIDNNAYISTGTGDPRAVTSHDNPEISAGVAIHRSEFGITNGLFWSPKGEKLGFYEMDESMVTDYPLANYTAIPAEINPIKYPMAGQASHHARAGIYDVATGNLVYLNTGEPKEQYLTNFVFSPDGKLVYLAVLNRDQNHMKLNTYDAGTGAFVKTLFEEKHDRYVEPEHPPVFIEGLKDAFIWQSERDGFDHLYLYQTDGKLVRQLTKGNFDVLEIVGFTPKGKEIILKITEGTMDQALISVQTSNGKSRKLTNGKGILQAEMPDGGDMILVKHKSFQVPNRVYTITTSGKMIHRFVNADNPYESIEMGETKFPVFDAVDGTQLQARLIKPYDFDSTRKYPVIVYLYGGSHAQMVVNSPTGGAPLWMYHAANRGYLVFTVDGRGSAHRGLAFEQATHRRLGVVEMEDQLAGVDYLRTLTYADTEKMAVHGWSFGGFLSTSLMLHHPDVFKVAVAGGPVTDWRMYEVMYTERYMGTPENNPEGYEKADLKNYVNQLEGKLLLIHGLDDDVVVPQHSYTLLEAFVKAEKQVDFFVYPGHPHNVRGKDRVHLMEKVLGYIDLHLKGN